MLKILEVRLQQCVNFQMFKLDLAKAEEPEIKWPPSVGSWKKQGGSRKTSTFALLSTPKPLTVWITINYGKFFKRWNTRPPYLPPEKSACRPRSNSYNWTWNNRLVPNRERSASRLHIVTLLIQCIFRLYLVKCQVGWRSSWYQDFQEKYQ